MARVTKDPDERRSELIACAQTLFYEKGYESTSVSDIVDAVGVAKGTFYYYFGSKQAVLEALVEDLVKQSAALLHEIVADETLPVLEKWARAFQAMGTWKADQKDEMLAILQVMQMDENLLLQYKVEATTVQLLSPEFAKIIAQGVREAVFQTEFVEESAQITVAIVQGLSEPITDVLLNPDNYPDPAAIVRRKFAAVETAVERVLGAPQGSLSLINEQIFATWFED